MFALLVANGEGIAVGANAARGVAKRTIEGVAAERRQFERPELFRRVELFRSTRIFRRPLLRGTELRGASRIFRFRQRPLFRRSEFRGAAQLFR